MASMCRLTGLLPIAHPPGRATLALLNLANKGPKTNIEALMVLTNSYLAFKFLIEEGST